MSFVFGWGFPSPIIKSHQNKKWVWLWARGAPQKFGVPFDIFSTAKASDFKFGTQLVFAKTHHKITPIGKSGHDLGLGRLPKIMWFHFSIYTILSLG